MLKFCVGSLVVLSLLSIPLFSIQGADSTPAGQEKNKKGIDKEAGKNIFGLTKLHQVHIEVGAREYGEMQPKGGGFPGGGFPGGPQAPDKAPTKFNYDFQYVHAKVHFGEHEFPDVALRYKGNGTYLMSAQMLRRSFKIDFDMYDENLRLDGLKKINLNNGITDPTRTREVLAYGVYRDAGVPAPRTALAEVRLTVPGRYRKELLGVYTVIEQIDKDFLKKHFGSAKGMLLKPEGLKGLEYFGEDWTLYEKRYLPKDEPNDKQKKRLIEFVRLVEKADATTFAKEIGNYLDIEAFTKFLATTAMIANMDSILTLGHNYYMYLSPENNKFYFFPWDLDLSFGTFMVGGSQTQQADLSIDHPHLGDNKFIERLLSIKEHKQTYYNQYRKLLEGPFTKEKLFKQHAEISKEITTLLANEKKASNDRREFNFALLTQASNPDEALKNFIEKRIKSVEEQLAGKSRGYIPGTGWGVGGFNPPPAPPSPANNLAKAIFAANDINRDGKLDREEWKAATKKLFEVCDIEKKGKLKEVEFAAGLDKALPQQQGFGGFRPSNKPMANSLSRGLYARLSKEASGVLTLAELETISSDVFKTWDKNNNGNIDEKELETGLTPLMPPTPGGFGLPGGFGPPGGGFNPPKGGFGPPRN